MSVPQNTGGVGNLTVAQILADARYREEWMPVVINAYKRTSDFAGWFQYEVPNGEAKHTPVWSTWEEGPWNNSAITILSAADVGAPGAGSAVDLTIDPNSLDALGVPNMAIFDQAMLPVAFQNFFGNGVGISRPAANIIRVRPNDATINISTGVIAWAGQEIIASGNFVDAESTPKEGFHDQKVSRDFTLGISRADYSTNIVSSGISFQVSSSGTNYPELERELRTVERLGVKATSNLLWGRITDGVPATDLGVPFLYDFDGLFPYGYANNAMTFNHGGSMTMVQFQQLCALIIASGCTTRKYMGQFGNSLVGHIERSLKVDFSAGAIPYADFSGSAARDVSTKFKRYELSGFDFAWKENRDLSNPQSVGSASNFLNGTNRGFMTPEHGADYSQVARSVGRWCPWTEFGKPYPQTIMWETGGLSNNHTSGVTKREKHLVTAGGPEWCLPQFWLFLEQ